ncbi:major facilitator superfamily domain-containing protein [Mariannaea sp. PMI_226]|nr:major facilitator superfamily domain-containing protein [Mariannaea sp. PMI_226]
MKDSRVETSNEPEPSGRLSPTEWQDEPGPEVDHDGLRRISMEPDEPLPSTPPSEANPNAPIAWRDLPRKDQLFILTLARMSEPLTQSSLQAYMYYQLKSFNGSLPDSTISAQAGVIYAAFTAAQFITAMIWGRIADSPKAGRKTVLLIGLCGTSVSCIGFGFSKSFWQALLFRTLGGMTNGNVGVMRTMISEIIREKKFQSRAFLLLPMTFNVGVIIGPILGGILSDPAGSYPDLFGKVKFFLQFPYALPNIISSIFLACAATIVWLGLEETQDVLREKGPDLGSRLGKKLFSLIQSKFSNHPGVGYSSLPTSEVELAEGETPVKLSKRRYTQRLPFRQMFTRNVVLTLVASFLMGTHLGSFNSLWFVFLSTPSWDPKTSKNERHLPFFFTGGLGLQPRSVGFAMAILGIIGITLQLFLYPRISARLGNLKAWRIFQCCFPLTYFIVPYLSVVPSNESSPPPGPKGGPAIWLAIIGVLAIQVLGRTFALPSQTILVNNASPHPSVLGSIHGVGQSVNSASRTFGPMLGGVIYGFGLNNGMIGLVWWIMSGIAICAVFASTLVKEGDGHEIWLEGDEDDTIDATPRGQA